MAPANPEFQVVPGRLREDATGQPAATETAVAGHEAGGEESAGTELMLMALSSGIAVAGILIAMYFWVWNRAASARIARSVTGIYTLLLNKSTSTSCTTRSIVRPIKKVSTMVLWRGADAALIDGAVNGVGKPCGRPATASGGSRPDRSAPTPPRCSSESCDSRLVFDALMLLTTIVFLPLAGALLVLLAGGRGDRPDREALVRNLALGVSLVSLASTLYLWWASTRRAPTSSSSRTASGCRSSASPTISASTASACS